MMRLQRSGQSCISPSMAFPRSYLWSRRRSSRLHVDRADSAASATPPSARPDAHPQVTGMSRPCNWRICSKPLRGQPKRPREKRAMSWRVEEGRNAPAPSRPRAGLGRTGAAAVGCRDEPAMRIGRYKVAILADTATVKLLAALTLFAPLCALVPCDFAAAAVVPLPRPRPAEISTVPPAPEATPEEAPAPSACRLRLTAELAIAPSLPALAGAGECVADDVVRLEAVRLADRTQVAVTPPAVVRCSFAEAIVHWVREDVVPAVRSLGGALKSIDNYAAYDCRGRNRIIGARLSEHGKANALDVRSVKLANGTVLELTDPTVGKDFRERVRKDRKSTRLN